ncbi:TIGR03087 family PEP-CTERM/XrtA system glycosyltransferase [Sphingomonas sp. M1-B02]|uniref:TIGR03087 family PEP-CTERM/XrtA system glycosyltransferase n=1 Tax=Sphingomonas sp. M1-B02 TaxID=3114300 RepID=UPI0022402799|nr:TIGR03087 family PEP-CTERM/XrtA system glycosyltransferase [Sphingomonas sp. S6-11]UZK68027.1 TIGR03087 family PEP-CTERM/XrtA system glycosyltransferase [Sphingomonas sp. S6-11]
MGDILFLAHRVPFPPDRGDKIRGFHLLKFLSARKRVRLIAFADDPKDMAERSGLVAQSAAGRSIVWRGKSQLRAGIEALLSGRPLSLTAFGDDAVRVQVAQALAGDAIGTVFLFSSQMAQYLPRHVRQRVIMDFVDMDSAKFAAYAEGAAWPISWIYRREARLLLAHEKAVAARADASLFVSRAEADLFRECTGAPRVHAIENGIDTDYFDPATRFEAVDATGAAIVFTGQMDYRPNIEAVRWFAEAILPQIRRVHADARFVIVGRNPTDAVTALGRLPGVTVTGEVRDVRGWLARADVVVAPLKLARGVQNKILEGMAMARPVVASAAAAEGIDHDATITVGTTAEEIGAAVIGLLSDPRSAFELGAAARERVIARYSWEARLAPLAGLMDLPAVEQTNPKRSAA